MVLAVEDTSGRVQKMRKPIRAQAVAAAACWQSGQMPKNSNSWSRLVNPVESAIFDSSASTGHSISRRSILSHLVHTT